MSQAANVSVIIPCFNYGRFLKECLTSVATQTLKPVETLIIDDGSTDPETLTILDELAEPGIKVIHQKNRGLGGARNTGIRNAKGKYVYSLDADDMLFPDCLETLATSIEADSIAACCGIRFVGGKHHGKEWLPSYNIYNLLVDNLWAAGMLLRRAAVERYHLWYDDSMRCHGYEDWELNIRLSQTGKPVTVVRKALYHYRVHGSSLLAESRNQHAEIISYLREKHNDLYTAESLLNLKRRHAPALAIDASSEEQTEMKRWLAAQSFQDCILSTETNAPNTRYRLIHAGVAALDRLPPEAIESGVMSLESNHGIQSCQLAVRLDNSVLSLGNSWRRQNYQPVAIIVRAGWGLKRADVRDGVDRLEQPIPFADQLPGSAAGWKPIAAEVFTQPAWNFRDPVAVRKRLSALGERLLGNRCRVQLVKLYDFVYYRILFSPGMNDFRRLVQRVFGRRGEQVLARLFYGMFLARSQPIDASSDSRVRLLRDPDPPALFLTAAKANPPKTTLLIATAWLNQGGVEQEIIDLCNHLDRSRFRILVATTKHSAHPWESLVRKSGTAVYHLADSLNARCIRNGLAHLIANHGVDVLHIVHSREAYEALPLLRKVAPYLAVSDRNVTVGGGFPKISGRLGAAAIDVRTVGYRRLAQQMAYAYGLRPATLKVIYAGTDLHRMAEPPDNAAKLHQLCNVSPDIPIVLFMGRLDPEKRPDVFLRTAREILEQQPDCRAHFALVGDGEMRSYLHAMVAKLRVSQRVHLLGFRLNAHDLISDSALIMIPSAYEGVALVSFEAMAAGVPQISADVGGQSELITADTGVLIKNGRGEIGRYARACIELLFDPVRRERMAAGKDRIRSQFTTENAVKEYSRIFEELAELSRKRALEIPHLRPPHINPLHELA